MSAHLRKMAILAAALMAAGCAVPEHMRVGTGDEPGNIDEDVRFRTTYYFRVFDACVSENGETQIKLQTDSLYRYRMTGKAYSLTTQVHFESGTLKAYEIDPLGANVVYDEKSNRFRFESQAEQDRKNFDVEVRKLAGLAREMQDLDQGNDLKAFFRLQVGGLVADAVGSTPEYLPPQIAAAKAKADRQYKIATENIDVMIEKTKEVNSDTSIPLDDRATIKISEIQVLAAFYKMQTAHRALLRATADPNSRDGLFTLIKESTKETKNMEKLNLNVTSTPKIDAAKKAITVAVEAVQTTISEISAANLQFSAAAPGRAATAKSLGDLYEDLVGLETDQEIRKALIARIVKLIGGTDVVDPNTLPPPARAPMAAATASFLKALVKYDEMQEKLKGLDIGLLKADRDKVKGALKPMRQAQEALTKRAVNPASGTTTDKSIFDAIEIIRAKLSKIDRTRDEPTGNTELEPEKKANNAIIEALNAINVAIGSIVNANVALAGGGGGVSAACPPGLNARRGFQVLGPEGWRTFDQDERLILAMSSSGRPLINTLKDLSNRVLNEQKGRDVALLELVRERLKVTKGERALDPYRVGQTSPREAGKTLDAAIKAFEGADGENR